MIPRIALAVLVVLLQVSTAAASGSYVRASAHRAGLDDYPKYELGRNVSQGRIDLPAPESEAQEVQSQLLTGLENQLPRPVRARVNLQALAGRLSPEQLDAVRYYLKIRYRVR